MNFKRELENITLSNDCIEEVTTLGDIHATIQKALMEISKQETYRNCEIVFNSRHLKGVRHKLNGTITYFGIDCDFSQLEKDLSFIVRPVIGKTKKKETLSDYSNEELMREINNRLGNK